MVKMVSKNNKNNEDGDESWGADLRRGPWKPTEDAMVIEHVKKFGEGNWTLLGNNSELRRSIRSCRLRWAKHLRPGLKKGAFSEEEEKTIVDLHAVVGNKWSLIASKLSGRTDHDIRNFWKTRMNKRLRESLQEYPPQMLQQAPHYSSSASSSSFYSVLASCYPKDKLSSIEPPPNLSAANPPQNHNQKQPNQTTSSSYTMSPYYRASSSSSLPHCKSSGLLNDVVMDGNNALCRKGKSKMDATIATVSEEEELADKKKIIEEGEEPPLPPVGTIKEEEAAIIIATQTSTDPSSSHQLISTEKNDNGASNNNNKEALNNCMPQMDDELLSELKNCPIYSPVQNWYKVDGDEDFLDDGDWNLGNLWNFD